MLSGKLLFQKFLLNVLLYKSLLNCAAHFGCNSFELVGFARTAVNQVKSADIRPRQATAASSQGRAIGLSCFLAKLANTLIYG